MGRRPNILIVAALTIVIAAGTFAAELGELKDIYKRSLEALEATHRTRADDLPGEYAKTLQGLEAQAQATGQLEAVLAIRTERGRFNRDKTVPTVAADSLPPSVAYAQRQYHTAYQNLLLEHSQAIVRLTEQYLTRLDTEKRQLTVNGQIDEALEMKHEASRVTALASYKAAQFALADAAAGSAPEPSAPPEARDTVALPGAPGLGPDCCVRWGGTRLAGGIEVVEEGRSRSGRIEHEGGNAVRRGAIVCAGGRSLIHGANDALLSACKESSELTIQLSCEINDVKQSGPARIFSFSLDGQHRNVSVCQERGKLVLRLRTTETGENGTNPEVKLCDVEAGQRLSLVITYRPGQLRAYANGEAHEVQQIEGTLSNWDDHQLVIGNDWKADRPWTGNVHGFEFTSRAASAEEGRRLSRLSLGR